LRLDANELKIAGIPFQVYFHQLSKGSKIGGTFMDMGDKRFSSVFLSLSMAIHLISSYISSNNLQAIKINRIGRNFLMQKHSEGSIANLEKEKVMEMVHHFVGTRLMELEIHRLFTTSSAADYMNLVEAALSNIAMHEAAHVLHKEAGILGDGSIAKEEERACLTELAYGNAALSFAYLPTKKKDDPNCIAGRSIIEKIFLRNDLGYLLNSGKDQISDLAKELLDEDFFQSFGRHHDQIIPKLEIYRVRKHRFFSDKHLPMIESLRYLPRKKAA
jgi:hypothetical protein